MADPLYELLAPYFDRPDALTTSQQTATYLTRLSTLSLADLATTEPASLLQFAQSHIRNLQALTKRSHKAVIASSTELFSLTELLPELETQAKELRDEVPYLEHAASSFAQKYDRRTENAVLDRRKRAMLLCQNMDRVSDVLELPTLLSSTVAAAQATSTASAASSATSYSSALDLQAHIKRLSALYPQSELLGSISVQADEEMQNMTSMLITALQSPQLKLAGGMRTVGWLRRVAPDLAGDEGSATKPGVRSTGSLDLSASAASNDGALGSLFLVCRLQTLHKMLDALEPLRELADQESARRDLSTADKQAKQQSQPSALGSQSERYLKRYIEIFREQSFNITSMYKSIFPAGLPRLEESNGDSAPNSRHHDPLLPLPMPIASFAFHLVDLLTDVLKSYMPNISDKSARESLLTQVLYCAGSLGRLGADFGVVIALIGDGVEESANGANAEAEWVSVMRKHRVQAGRLEVLARGVGSGRKASADSPAAGLSVS